MLRPDRADIDRAMILIVDVQEKLLPAIRDHGHVLRACGKLLDGARGFDLPVLATRQYPKGLGPIDAGVCAALDESGATVIDKATFSCCDEPAVRDAINKLDRPQIIVAGIETHVCVQQTVLDLLAMDFDAFVCADAVGSRAQTDSERALSRLQHAGAVVTTVEAVLFELCERCDTPRFKTMLDVIKKTPAPQDGDG